MAPSIPPPPWRRSRSSPASTSPFSNSRFPPVTGRSPPNCAAVRRSPSRLDEELIPVADAATRQWLLDTIHPQHLILKPALLGGFAIAGEWIADAEARRIQWWTNSLLESNIGLNAICQWTGALGGDRTHGLGTGGLFTNNFPSPIRLAGIG